MKVLVILGVLCLNDLGLETLKQNNIRDTWETNMRLLNREGHERDSFNSRFLGSLQVLILEINGSQWKPRNHSVHLQRISNSWVEWETSHCLHYYFIMLELLKKLWNRILKQKGPDHNDTAAAKKEKLSDCRSHFHHGQQPTGRMSGEAQTGAPSLSLVPSDWARALSMPGKPYQWANLQPSN